MSDASYDPLDFYIPDIDEDVPLPENAKQAFPDLAPPEELQMRARTIKLISDLACIPLVPTPETVAQAGQMATELAKAPSSAFDYASYPNETIAFLAGMVNQMNAAIVDDLAELKLYVVNKLVYEIENAKDSKSRIIAITALGNIDGVDAFKRRTEVTHVLKPIEEVERELRTLLDGIEYRVLPQKALQHEAESLIDAPRTGTMATSGPADDDSRDPAECAA